MPKSVLGTIGTVSPALRVAAANLDRPRIFLLPLGKCLAAEAVVVSVISLVEVLAPAEDQTFRSR